MDKQIQNIKPNYIKIYSDIIHKKFPEKMDQCKNILQKENLSVLDILELNKKIFGNSELDTEKFNQRHRAYNETAIKQILDYQSKNKCNNTELAKYFKLSRNTVTRWKKLFIDKK
nr:helix-turn-helix domain-containing protein [Chryseobacterium pyrolae]